MSEVAHNDNDSSATAICALLSEVQALFDRGRNLEAIARCDEVVTRFGGETHGRVPERVAYALLLKGIGLGVVGNSDEAIITYDELITGYGGSDEPRIREHVGWALNNKASRLKDLGRLDAAIATYDELVARLGHVGETPVRMRVDWALWNKSKLLDKCVRGEERESVYDELIARRDEGLDVELDRVIAWCMEERAWNAGQAGDTERKIDLCGDLVRRFGDAPDLRLRRHVLAALRMRADALAEVGRADEALATYEEIMEQFGGATDSAIQDAVAESLRRKAIMLAALGRGNEAIGAYDEALALLADTSAPQLRLRVIEVLLSKGVTLTSLDRRAEAVVIYDSAASVYLAVPHWGDAVNEALWRVVLALLYKVWLLCELDRGARAADVRGQLVAVLGDVIPPTLAARQSPAGGVHEAELAAAFANVFDGNNCWPWFVVSRGEPSGALMAERALELYRLTEPWLAADLDGWTGAPEVAAGLLRDVADGYAMLARPWSTADRDALPLPERAEPQRAHLIRRSGLDEWAAELGYPISVRELVADAEDVQPDEELLEQQKAEPIESATRFVRSFVILAYSYDLLVALCDSPSGREIIRNDNFRLYACHQISEARKWIRRLRSRSEEAPGAAFAGLFIAQGFFVASHQGVSSSATLFPSARLLRGLVRDDETCMWFLDSDANAPRWLTDDDD
jgi:tetratricopeptide (TPR) repeat protein